MWFRWQLLRKTWPIKSAFIIFLLLIWCFVLDSVSFFFISHTIGPIDLLHPSPAPHFKTFQVFLVLFTKCPSFSATHMCHANYMFILCTVGNQFASQATNHGARGGAVGRGTALQAGMSRVRFPIESLEFFSDLILPVVLWPLDRLSF
jgi:hypothetical protein